MTAYLSDDRVYRYSLTRYIGGLERLDDNSTVTFIGLNPSTADEHVDDPTIRRCIRFARDWGYARLEMLNLYAYRATDPKALLLVDDPIGPDNDCTIEHIVDESDLVVCAWGNLGQGDRAAYVLARISDPHCLGYTKIGAPKHPLYVPAATTPLAMTGLPPKLTR